MTETLKTRRQWRKQGFRKVRKGEQPAAYTTIHFTAHKHRQLIGPVAKEWTEPVEVEKKIALFTTSQTEPYQRVGAVLLRDAYYLLGGWDVLNCLRREGQKEHKLLLPFGKASEV